MTPSTHTPPTPSPRGTRCTAGRFSPLRSVLVFRSARKTWQCAPRARIRSHLPRLSKDAPPSCRRMQCQPFVLMFDLPSVRVVPQCGRMRWRCSSAPALRRARSTRWKRECPHPQRFQLASGRKPGERRRWKLSLNPPLNLMHISGLRTCTTCRILHCAQSGSAIQNYPKTRFFV